MGKELAVGPTYPTIFRVAHSNPTSTAFDHPNSLLSKPKTIVIHGTGKKNTKLMPTRMAATSLLPKCASPLLTSPPPSISLTNLKNISFLTFPSEQHVYTQRSCKIRPNAKKKNPWLDPFDDGEDPEMEYGSLFSEGKQEEDPRPPDNPDNPYGFLKFPMGYAVEIASLGLKIRGDVRRCCCVISGGVYENLLFFPAIQLLKDRYPGVQIDVVASPRGKQTYELNKNVRWANTYDPDDDFPEPAEYLDFIGVLKVGHSTEHY